MCEVCFDAVEDLEMPNKVIDSLRLPEEMDRRRKLTSAQKDDIKAKYVGGARICELCAEYKVSRHTIQFIVHPELYERSKERNRDRKNNVYKDAYYDKEYNRKNHASVRRRKAEALACGMYEKTNKNDEND